MVFWQLTIDAKNPALLARFWAHALGYQPVPPAEPETTWHARYRARLGEKAAFDDRIFDPAGLRGSRVSCGCGRHRSGGGLMAARKIVVTCGGCSKTQAVRPSRIEPCDGYYCMPEHGPKERQPAGLLREHLINAAGGFWGWRDVAATPQARDGIARARAILAFGQAKLIVDVAAGGVS